MTGRFVVLWHELPAHAPRPSHWDLLLASGDKLRAWALDAPPSSGRRVRATALPDHRLAYLDYEGPVGGGRGSVSRYDGGTYELLCDEAGAYEVRLHGGRFSGTVRFTQVEGQWCAECVGRSSEPDPPPG